MIERQVTGTGKSSDGTILSICGTWGTTAKKDAVLEIEVETHHYFVKGSGGSVDVVVVDGDTEKYLRTEPDLTKTDNLASLPGLLERHSITMTVQELLEAIAREDRLWVRLCAVFPEQTQEWRVSVIDITAGAEPPNWSAFLWSYPKAMLYAGEASGALVHGWLEARHISFGAVTAQLPELVSTDLSRATRHSSGSTGFHGRFEWPYQQWDIPFRETIWPSADGELIGEGDTPTFLNSHVAAAYVLGVQLQPGGGFDARSAIFRQQFTSARIAGVRIGPTAMTVDVDGPDAQGAVVELASDQPGPRIDVPSNEFQSLSLPTPKGPPRNAWVVLRRNGDWIDRRFLSYPYAQGQADDVLYEVEPSEQLETLVAGGESPTVEFKQELPKDRLGVMKTVAAFSNEAGGTILIGVANDGEVVGAPNELTGPRGSDSLTNMIRNWIQPLPVFAVEILPTHDNSVQVAAIFVEKGPLPPYGAGTKPDEMRYYVRRGATTFTAAPEQIRELVRQTFPIDTPGPEWF